MPDDLPEHPNPRPKLFKKESQREVGESKFENKDTPLQVCCFPVVTTNLISLYQHFIEAREKAEESSGNNSHGTNRFRER